MLLWTKNGSWPQLIYTDNLVEIFSNEKQVNAAVLMSSLCYSPHNYYPASQVIKMTADNNHKSGWIASIPGAIQAINRDCTFLWEFITSKEVS